jgi:hypothetical protein
MSQPNIIDGDFTPDISNVRRFGFIVLASGRNSFRVQEQFVLPDDGNGVSQRRHHMLFGQRRMAPDEIFGTRPLGEPVENEFNRDACASENGFAEHHSGDTFDVRLPIHAHAPMLKAKSILFTLIGQVEKIAMVGYAFEWRHGWIITNTALASARNA